MEFEITSDEFWFKLKGVYPVHENWHIEDKRIQDISKRELGLRYIETIYTDKIDRPYSSIFKFKIVNKQNFLWAKMKYGI
jgi:hypothetical protein